MVSIVFKVSLLLVMICYAEMMWHLNSHSFLWGDRAVLDTYFQWDHSKVTELFEALGASGRKAWRDIYFGLYLGGDLLFPIYYSTMLASLMRASGSPVWLLPVLAGIADFLENLCVLNLLAGDPDSPSLYHVFWGGSVFTPAKYCLIALSFVALAHARCRGSPRNKTE
eukprot:gb/GEZN01017880.1/.p1 GENE.gb/GEZN01017880.1/~~gb/GEZN01017880.1/.p1  ORF type:complete len:168 (-),score=14.02 gb/GEZN01017880.1/:241-744(-)